MAVFLTKQILPGMSARRDSKIKKKKKVKGFGHLVVTVIFPFLISLKTPVVLFALQVVLELWQIA